VSWFYKEVGKSIGQLRRLLKMQWVLIGLVLCLLIFQVNDSFENARDLSEDNFYPKNAVGYLRKNLPATCWSLQPG